VGVKQDLHHRDDGIKIAKVCGIVARHAERPPLDMAAAVAEIRAVTTDPHLLGHAWRWPPAIYPDPWREVVNDILTAAGAAPQER
jgi:hypothetical protein